MRTAAGIALSLCLLVMLGPAARAEERITEFAAVVRVLPDATLEVTESITVDITGDRIKRGIVRIFPLDYQTDSGRVHRTGFDLVGVTLDGKKVPVATKRSGGKISLVIGDPKGSAPRGIHTYEITYRATNHIRFLSDRDAIYWNVTGNDWEFPIDQASARVVLPDGARIVAVNAYTGKRGVAGSDFTRRDLSFATTRPLALGEGLTIAVDWEKGMVTQPPPGAVEKVRGLLEGRRWPALFGFLLAALAIFVPVWLLFGRDPEEGPIVPVFHPPEGMDPGYMTMLLRGKTVPLCLGADIMELAVRRALILEDGEGKRLLLRKNSGTDAARPLSPLDQTLLTSLFKRGKELIDSKKDSAAIVDAYRKLGVEYRKRTKGFFVANAIVSFLCVVPLLAVFFGLVVVIPGPIGDAGPGEAAGILMAMGMGSGLLYFGLSAAWAKLASSGRNILLRLIGLPFSLFLPAAGAAILYLVGRQDTALSVAVGAGVVTAFFFITRAMPRRSAECVRQTALVKGLAMYISLAEKERLAVLNAPGDSVEEYERLLPHAIALDCAAAWERRFEPLLRRLDYRPEWYRRREEQNFHSRQSAYAPIQAATLAAMAIDAARLHERAASSGSSSWSGGSGSSGGSSGGGSGGGGGGGW